MTITSTELANELCNNFTDATNLESFIERTLHSVSTKIVFLVSKYFFSIISHYFPVKPYIKGILCVITQISLS